METESLRIRPMKRRDLSSVRKADRSTQAQPWTNKEWMICLAQKTTRTMVVEWRRMDIDYRSIIGFITIDIGNEIDILRISVREKFRRCGVGTALLQEVRALVFNDREPAIPEFETMSINVWSDDDAFDKFLRRNGFKAGYIKRNWLGSGSDVWVYQLRYKNE
jgi:ribosomal protein S18 acetylase RimI-like enzyme